jgi:hypothetical protein
MSYAVKRVALTKDDQVIEVKENNVERYEERGWTRADDGSSEETEEQPTKKAAAKKTASKEG